MIRVCEPSITELEKRYVNEALDNNWISSNAPPVRLFEERFSEKFGFKHSIVVNSGGSALFTALWGLGIRAGDEVIVPDFTMIASAAAVTQCGAKPVFVDVKPGEFTIDPENIREKITPRTRAIMPVHIYGHMCDMDPIMEIAREFDLKVIEDCAEVHGATYKGKYAGTFGDVACFSFYSNKLMTTGEGGMVSTNDDELAEKVKGIRSFFIDEKQKYIHKELGWNFRMSSLEASLGLAQLERLDELVEKRRKNAEYYNEKLKVVSQITTYPELPNEHCVYWMYAITCENRDELADFLYAEGIETRPFFQPIHSQPIYQERGEYLVTERLAKEGLYLPSSSDLSEADRDYVIEKIKEFYLWKLETPMFV